MLRENGSPRSRAPGVPPAVPRRRRRLFGALACGAAVAALATMYFVGVDRGIAKAPIPSFHQLTFRRGGVVSARFTSDVRTRSFILSFVGRRPRSPLLDADRGAGFNALGASGRGPRGRFPFCGAPGFCRPEVRPFRRLRVAAFQGSSGRGSPRVVAEESFGADWGADPNTFAIVRTVGGQRGIEYPIGKVLLRDDTAYGPRVSRDGRRIAFLTTAPFR